MSKTLEEYRSLNEELSIHNKDLESMHNYNKILAKLRLLESTVENTCANHQAQEINQEMKNKLASKQEQYEIVRERNFDLEERIATMEVTLESLVQENRIYK